MATHDYLVEQYFPPFCYNPKGTRFVHARRIGANERDYRDSLSCDAITWKVVEAVDAIAAARDSGLWSKGVKFERGW